MYHLWFSGYSPACGCGETCRVGLLSAWVPNRLQRAVGAQIDLWQTGAWDAGVLLLQHNLAPPDSCNEVQLHSPCSLLLGLWAISGVAVNAVRLTRQLHWCYPTLHCPLSMNHSNSSERSEDTEDPQLTSGECVTKSMLWSPHCRTSNDHQHAGKWSASACLQMSWGWTVVFHTPTNGMKKSVSLHLQQFWDLQAGKEFTL